MIFVGKGGNIVMSAMVNIVDVMAKKCILENRTDKYSWSDICSGCQENPTYMNAQDRNLFNSDCRNITDHTTLNLN